VHRHAGPEGGRVRTGAGKITFRGGLWSDNSQEERQTTSARGEKIWESPLMGHSVYRMGDFRGGVYSRGNGGKGDISALGVGYMHDRKKQPIQGGVHSMGYVTWGLLGHVKRSEQKGYAKETRSIKGRKMTSRGYFSVSNPLDILSKGEKNTTQEKGSSVTSARGKEEGQKEKLKRIIRK